MLNPLEIEQSFLDKKKHVGVMTMNNVSNLKQQQTRKWEAQHTQAGNTCTLHGSDHHTDILHLKDKYIISKQFKKQNIPGKLQQSKQQKTFMKC